MCHTKAFRKSVDPHYPSQNHPKETSLRHAPARNQAITISSRSSETSKNQRSTRLPHRPTDQKHQYLHNCIISAPCRPSKDENDATDCEMTDGHSRRLNCSNMFRPTANQHMNRPNPEAASLTSRQFSDTSELADNNHVSPVAPKTETSTNSPDVDTPGWSTNNHMVLGLHCNPSQKLTDHHGIASVEKIHHPVPHHQLANSHVRKYTAITPETIPSEAVWKKVVITEDAHQKIKKEQQSFNDNHDMSRKRTKPNPRKCIEDLSNPAQNESHKFLTHGNQLPTLDEFGLTPVNQSSNNSFDNSINDANPNTTTARHCFSNQISSQNSRIPKESTPQFSKRKFKPRTSKQVRSKKALYSIKHRTSQQRRL